VEDKWYLPQEVELQEQGCIKAEVFIPDDSLWFSGHFPQEPILPGVAIILMVWRAIVQGTGKQSKEIMLDALKRVRFTQPVRPGERVSVHINCGGSGDKTSYTFKVLSRGNVICSGLIAASINNQYPSGNCG
jgi:3-hydroxymyristoyl/3-hydroxydecanoyl-(acyl carrier protein) dehydratase